MINLILDPDARELATKLDGLPLALATAGAYLSQVSTSLADYLRYYNSSWLRLQETSPELSSYEDALYSTWNISYKHIHSRNESAGKLLQLWAYFDNQDLWYALLAGGSKCSPEWFSTIIDDELNFNEAIRLLCDHALVESHGVSGGYGMHSCVHAWIMHVLNSERDISMAKLALNCVSSATSDRTVLEYSALQRRLLPHANRCLELVYNASIFDLRDCVHILNAANNLGILYSDQGKMKEAEEMYLRALAGKEKARGPEHKSTLDTVNNLGLLYKNQGKMKEAEEMYLRALTGYEKAWGSEHTSTLRTVNNLGNLYSNQGKMKEAEEMYLRALAGYEKVWGPEHKRPLDTIYNLAVMYKKRLMFEDAAKHFELVVQGYTKILGPEHSETVEALDQWKGCKDK
jgi:tetratricopeptide (TPR) repeat protein